MANTTRVTMGLVSVEYGDVDKTTGTMPTSGMHLLGNTYKDSFSMSADTPEITELFIEESDLPVETQGELGKVTLAWDMLKYGVDELKEFIGGDLGSESTEKSWSAPQAWKAVEKAFRLTPKKGFKVEIPRANCVCSLTGGWKKGEPMLLHFEVTVLVPSSSTGEQKAPYILKPLLD